MVTYKHRYVNICCVVLIIYLCYDDIIFGDIRTASWRKETWKMNIHKIIFEETGRFGTYGRTGVLHTRAGDVLTPTFMPDGTRGAVKGLTPQQVVDTGVQVVLANTYHLHLAPGEQVIAELGGLHVFANRKGPMLTDSGGFQVFSLGEHTKVTEEGVHFKDPKTGDKRFISPEMSMQIQLALGADMIVAFDHLIGLGDETPEQVRDAFDRTHRWLERCIVEFKRLTKDMIDPDDPEWYSDLDDRSDFSVSNGTKRTKMYDEASSHNGKSVMAPKRQSSATSSAGRQARRVRRPLLFGVVQGGLDIELRKQSLEIIQNSEADGIAIGGLSVGETREEMEMVLQALAPLYRADKPRFLLGVGTPEDLKIAVENGIDMLDCVLPTRNARHGMVWRRADAHSGRIPASSVLDVPSVRLRTDARASSQTALSDDAKQTIEDIRMQLTNEQFKVDSRPIDETCDCYTCSSGFSRAFLRHQFKVGEPLAGTLASIHNLRYMSKLCEEYRDT
jgi:queuine tRNA-ribosyltransferase